MKGRFGFFILGLFVGAVLTVFIYLSYSFGYLWFEGRQNNTVETKTETPVVRNQIDGLTMFETDGATIPALQIRVFQTLGANYALAQSTNERYSYSSDYNYLNALTIMLVNNGEYSIYDDLKINITDGKKLVQIGTYRYQTVDKQWKTVPVVEIK